MARSRYTLHHTLPILAVLLTLALSACITKRSGGGTPSRLDSLPPANGPWMLLPPSQDQASSDTTQLGDTIVIGTADSTTARSIGGDSASLTSAQERDLGGALSADSSSLDTLSTIDSLTAPTAEKKQTGIDDIIEYTAKDSIVMLGTNLVYLFGPSTVDYKDKGLEANFMRMRADSNLVYAHYVLDSLGQPTAHPKFKDGAESYEAKSMNYNFETGKGFITGVITEQGEGYVTAERTKKHADDCMFMEGGRYTTCTDHDHPHFYFKLTKAKVRPKKNIVFGPSYLVIGDIPLPIGLPFGIFPFSSTYSSGVIMPSYGDERTRGLYLREGGYYFALSDYIDLAITGDWYSRGSWGLNARSSYRKRYRYSGNFSASYLVTRTGDKDVAGTFSESKDFRLSWSHTQDPKANPNATFSASVNYSTSKYNHNSLNALYNPAVSSQNTKSSSISYSRNFVGTPFRLSASIDATQTSSNEQVTLNSPNLSISMSRIYPFKRKTRVGRERWYEKISLSYNGQLRNSITTQEDSLFKKDLIRDWRNGISHSIPISASYKLFDYIDLTLSASYTERWYSHKTRRRYNEDTKTVEQEREYGFNRVYDFNASASLSTTAYGFYKPWALFGDKVQMIRHRVTPSVGVSYRPDFGAERWGYYDRLRYTNEQGNVVDQMYSLYQEGLFGTPGAGKSASVNFSLDNNIEAKLRSKPDSLGEITYKKISLIDNFNISASYNLAADSFQLSDIQTRISLKLSKGFTLSLSGAFDPYVYTHQKDDHGNPILNAEGRAQMVRVNKLRVLNGRGIGSLRQTGTSFSYTFNNETFRKLRRLFTGDKDKKDKDHKDDDANDPNTPPAGDEHNNLNRGGASGGSLYAHQEDVQYDQDGYVVNAVPWSLSVNYGVNYVRNFFDHTKDEFRYKLVHSLMFSGNIQPTKNWNFTFSASYDFNLKQLTNMTLGITRDLHCWSFTASAIPVGPYKSYNFTIGVKSSLLRDLKYDKTSYSPATAWY